jgi:F0F1-type ATP synthase assembly protein I
MSQSPDKMDPKPTFAPFNLSVLALGGQVGCSTLAIVILSVFGGLWLDRFFDTKPVFTIFFILGSAPLALILTYWMAMRTLKGNPPASPDKKEAQTDKEEVSGE